MNCTSIFLLSRNLLVLKKIRNFALSIEQKHKAYNAAKKNEQLERVSILRALEHSILLETFSDERLIDHRGYDDAGIPLKR